MASGDFFQKSCAITCSLHEKNLIGFPLMDLRGLEHTQDAPRCFRLAFNSAWVFPQNS